MSQLLRLKWNSGKSTAIDTHNSIAGAPAVKREAEEDWGQGALAMSVAPPSGQNRIMIYGPKRDGTYVVEFRTADGGSQSPASETRVIRHFQERMPYGLFVPDIP